MDRIDALRLFAAVAELESFTRAAERLGMTAGAASKQISALEERMQARLLERTTRSVRLTDAGRALLDRVGPWLAEYDAIENGLVAEQAAAAGVLRVSAPVDFGSSRLIQPITAFMAQWPGVEVRLEFSDRMVDLVDEGFDLIIGPIEPARGFKACRFERHFQTVFGINTLSHHLNLQLADGPHDIFPAHLKPE